jgi:hypothetical protein
MYTQETGSCLALPIRHGLGQRSQIPNIERVAIGVSHVGQSVLTSSSL